MAEVIPLYIKTLVLLVSYFRSSEASGALLTAGLPSCYAHEHNTHVIPGLYEACPNTCTDSGNTEYLYCSKDQYCCTNDGCSACCVQ